MCVALAISGFCQAEVPKLLTERTFNSATLAEAANHFIAIGEEATFDELGAFMKENTAHTNYWVKPGYSVDERIAWVFRIIYVPKEPIPTRVPKTGAWIPGTIIPLRAPNFGALGIPEASMPAENWPLYPLALSGSTYVVLKEGYIGKDEPESINHYMEYCKANGVFRQSPVAVPTRDQALKETDQLRQSPSWKAIKWVNNGGIGFPFGEERTWAFIQNQASAIPEAVVTKEPSTATVPQLSAR